ncbi:hypothetical protein Egran_05678 [Elaphomyces granulatus]|uniref:Vacuolar iron transporter Ccc1 n=1 Tax=Elaphomyces granulatus TaxID=519963 RepID=A0A232LQW2_9EURO|nr:hypothetical protein Egran_05678 [Elaphomyces granulatus]
MLFQVFGELFRGILSRARHNSPSRDHEKYTTSYSKLSHAAESHSSTPEKSPLKVDARVISDAIIGLSDGLTVPFALTAGLSALGETKVVIYGGLAELIAGAISMGLGGYLASKSEEASYQAVMKQTEELVLSDRVSASTSISTIFAPYDLPRSTLDDLTVHLSQSSKLPDFLMHFQHTLEEPSGSRAMMCAFKIASGYFIGGFIPLIPYFLVAEHQVVAALCLSSVITIIALFLFGYGKTCFVSGWRGPMNVRKAVAAGFHMVLVGGVAAGSAMEIVKAFQYLSASESYY